MKKRQSAYHSSLNSGRKTKNHSRFGKKLFLALFFGLLGCALLYAGGAFPFSEIGKTSAQISKPGIAVKKVGSPDDGKISDEAAKQIQALLDEKESRTPAQKKIDSNLLYQIKMERGEPIAKGVEKLQTDLTVDDNGGITVDITARVTDDFIKKLKSLNAVITDSFPRYHTVTAKISIENIEPLAEMPDVIFIRASEKGNVWKNTKPEQPSKTTDLPPDFFRSSYPPNIFDVGRSTSFEKRARRVREYLNEKLAPADSLVGAATTEGDTTHQSNMVRSNIGVRGTNIKIGVLSNGVNTYRDRQATGDLPANLIVLPGQAGSGDEGTAMLEIVYDVAPGAQLYYATANPTPLRFAQNIRDLRAAGCDIIIDDVFFFVETPFQDGQLPSVISTTNGGAVIQAVNDVTADGAMYFSSAGNQGNKDDNTASAYQGDFVSGGSSTAPLPLTGTVHNFGGGQLYDLVAVASGNQTDLYWADPLGGSSNDYDLFTLNPTGTTVTSSSTNIQSGTQDPFEATAAAAVNSRIVVLKKTGAADRFFHITTNANGAGRLGTSTEGTTKGHSMAVNAFSVAATPATAPGPFPAAHSSSNVSETFTSDGPRRIFYTANGTAITLGNVSSTGGILRQKPDITAADGVTTTTPGFIPFYGTSAAAPHAGALAALIKSANPSLTNAQIRNAIISSAIDIETAGTDRDTGAGIFMPLPALASLGITTARAVIEKGSFTVGEAATGNDGDGQLEPNERGSLLIQTLQNVGAANATNVTATLSTTTSGVTILSPATLPFSDIAAGGSSSPNSTPYNFALAGNFTCGTPIDFVLTVNFTGGGSPQTLDYTVDTFASTTISSTLDATAPATGANYTATTGTQTNRVNRDGSGTSCDFAEGFPGSVAATNLRYDAYKFNAVNTGCTTVSYTENTAITGSNQLFSVAYGNGGFVPTNIATNYLGDAGSSPGTINIPLSYTFNATAGQSFTIVVHEVTSGGGTGVNYTLTVGGAPTTACNALAPTAADAIVAGRITTAKGRGLANAGVTLTDSQGGQRAVTTNQLGYFGFYNIDSGENYIVSVSAKNYQFNSQVITVNSDITDLNLVALP